MRIRQYLVQALLLVQEHQVPDGSDGQDDGQLEIPPHQDNEGQENVTGPAAKGKL